MGEILNSIRDDIHRNSQEVLPEDVGDVARKKWYLPTNAAARVTNSLTNVSILGTGAVMGVIAETTIPFGLAMGTVLLGQIGYETIKDKSRNKTFKRIAPVLRNYFERFGVVLTDHELRKFFKFIERAQVGEQKRINCFEKGAYVVFCKNETTFIVEQIRPATEIKVPIKVQPNNQQLLLHPENLFRGEIKTKLNNIDLLVKLLEGTKESLTVESQHLLERVKKETYQIVSDYSKLLMLNETKPSDTDDILQILNEKEASLLKAKEDLTSSLRNNLNIHKKYSEAQLDDLN